MTTRSRTPTTAGLTVRPLTPARWDDFVKLFGQRGACAGCWCMWWRRSRAEWSAAAGAGNKRAMKRLVDAGEVTGLLAYAGDEPVGWCSVAPRERFAALERSRSLKRLDDRPVWSVVCFFVARPYRRRGVTGALLAAAVEYARRQGARIVEGYPNDPGKAWPDAYAFSGLWSVFRRAGFAEAARPSRTRVIVRRALAAPRRRRQRGRAALSAGA
jgi:GNAT superfamily N-acetyltransferase